MPSTWAFKARAESSDQFCLDIYDSIGSDPLFGGGISAKSVLDSLAQTSKAKKIQVRINSAGGIVTEGLAIYNILKNHTAEVTCQVDGLAGSIASVIAMSGRLEMPASSYLMIHNPYGWIEGGASELRHQAEVLESMREMMLDIYCAKSGRPRDLIGALMDEEKWMTGTEALAYGFCDALIPEPKARLAAHFDLSAFRNTPRSLDPERQSVAQITPDNLTDAVRQALATIADEATGSATVAEASTEELTITETPAAKAAASGANTMDEQVYKDQIAALEAKVAELTAALDGEKSARAKAETEAAEAKAKFPKKGEDDEEDDEEEMAATKAVIAEAMDLTGCKDVKKLRGALVAHGLRSNSTSTKDAHAARVKRLCDEGKLPPHMRAKALTWTPADLDGFIELTGGEKFAPIGEEHTPDDGHEKVVAAKAVATQSASVATAAFDPTSITLTEAEKAFCRARDPLGTEKFADAYLATKRSEAEAAHTKKRGRAA